QAKVDSVGLSTVAHIAESAAQSPYPAAGESAAVIAVAAEVAVVSAAQHSAWVEAAAESAAAVEAAAAGRGESGLSGRRQHGPSSVRARSCTCAGSRPGTGCGPGLVCEGGEAAGIGAL